MSLPQISPSTQVNTIPIDSELTGYLCKISDLSWSEVGKLLKRFSCPLCRRNNHPFHLYNALKNTYSINLKTVSEPPVPSYPPAAPEHQPPTVNFVLESLPYTIDNSVVLLSYIYIYIYIYMFVYIVTIFIYEFPLCLPK